MDDNEGCIKGIIAIVIVLICFVIWYIKPSEKERRSDAIKKGYNTQQVDSIIKKQDKDFMDEVLDIASGLD